MADVKITALAVLTAADPINDAIPIVDVSDITMAASGTTKRISVNNILSSSPTASGNFTITGDLTVDTSTLKVDSTNDRVGVGITSPLAKLDIRQASAVEGLKVYVNDTGATNIVNFRSYDNTLGEVTRYAIACNGTATWSNVGGVAGTAMTLNSTGLGIGDAPSYKLHVAKTTDGTLGFFRRISGTINPALTVYCNETGNTVGFGTDYAGATSPSITFTTGGSERLRIDGSGNVGVGITPSAWATTTTIWRALDMQYSCGLASTGAGSGEIDLLWNAYYDQTDQRWEFKYTGDRASRYSIGGAGVHAWYNTVSTGTVNNPITWTQAMTLTATGELLVGTTTTSVASGGVVTYGGSNAQFAMGHATGTTGGTAYAGFQYAGTQIGSITQSGTTAVLYNTTSDYRLKESVKPLSGGLARVNALKPSIYNWKSDGSTGEGFLAHELAEVVPFAVSGEKDAMNADGTIKSQGIDMSRIVPILVAAIQELTAEVNALKNA